MKREFSAGVVVYHQTPQHRYYLLIKHGPQAWYGAGHWDFPKGHIEKGENKQQAALRELKEETGLELTLQEGFEHTFSYFFKNSKTHDLIHKDVYFFIAPSPHKDITLSFEHSDFAWLSFDKAMEKLTYKNAQELLTAVDAWLNNMSLQ